MNKIAVISMACLIGAGLLAGCAPTADLQASRAGDGPAPGPTLAQFTDIPIPAGASMNLERSLILGPADNWIGRLVFTASLGPQQMFEFYGREMPGFGWQEVTRVRARINIMTFTRGGRATTVQIMRTTLGGSEVDLTVSPQAQGGPAGAAGAPSPGAVVPAQ
jgi:hypothetical protein